LLSIPPERAWAFLAIFSVQFIGWLVFIVIQATSRESADVAAIVVLKGMASVVVVSTAISILLVEGGVMLAERYLRKRYREGREEGRKEVQAKWEAWNQHRMEFERAHPGETFDEPPPPR
jgi:hypothetical protein